MSSGPSKVIVLDPDPRAGRLVQLGFQREAIPVVVPPVAAGGGPLDISEDPALVLVGGRDLGTALDLVRRARAWVAARGADVPIVFGGRGAPRRELEAAGADEVIAQPAFLRDIVTLGRMLRGVPRGQRDHLTGNLADTTGVLTLVRAFAALGRSAVLTLIRGLRRGEVRFFHGEVTSAQVGLIHGQAALHQLLLWTDAKFDYAHEDIVRRQQIPLSAEELFADAEHFLEGVREHAGSLSPATILEQDITRVHALGKQIPTEVHGVLRMFDGHRVLADILEDSPYRVFETLRVAQKAVEVGLLRPVSAQRPKATWRAVLAIEEWLVGNETREAVVERTQALDSGPVKTSSSRKKKRGKRRSKRMHSQPAPPSRGTSDIDWGALVPRVIGAEVGPLSGVVPAHEAHGEVELPTRDKPREGLEALMDTQKRQRIFPTDIGLEPSIVVDDASVVVEAAPAASRTTPLFTAAVAPADSAQIASRPATAMTTSADEAAALPRRRRAERGDDLFVERDAAVAVPREAVNTARHTAPPPPTPDDAPLTASAPVPPPPSARTTDRHAAPPPVPATPPAGMQIAAPVDPVLAPLVAVPAHAVPPQSDPAAAVLAVPADAAPPAPADAAASALVHALVADAVPSTAPATSPTPTPNTVSTTTAMFERPDVTPPFERPAVTPPFERPALSGSEPAPTASALIAEPITVAEVGATSVAVADVLTVGGSTKTAVVTATPVAVISDQPQRAARGPGDGTPVALDDEPSDGVVRAMIASSTDTARAPRSRARSAAPAHDGPAIKETSGEVRGRARRDAKEPDIGEPSILVADLAAAHEAVAAVVAKPASTPRDAASPSRELAVADVRRDAVAFSEAEEAFFRGAERTAWVPKVETFDDLDEGYEPPKFWDRVFGRKKPK